MRGSGRLARFCRLTVAMTCLAAMVTVGSARPDSGAAPSARAGLVVPAAAAVTVLDGAAAAGLFEVNHSWSAKPVDYDGDGDEDIWIGYHQWSGKLWRNNGNRTYTRVATSAWPQRNSEGKRPDRHDCAWADVDRDGRPDAYCSAGRNLANVVKNGMDNELWLQKSPGVFTEVGTAWGVGDLCGRGRHVAFLNANGDAYPDLFLGNETPRNRANDPCNNPANHLPSEESKLFLNNHGTGFTQATTFGISGYGAGQRCAEVFDFNRDGHDDLIGCRLKSQTPRLYRGNGVTGFTEVAAASGLTTAISDATVVDFDNDGDPDLVFATQTEFTFRLNTNGHFGPSVRIAAVPSGGQGRSVAVGDVDGDGDLDVYGLICGSNHKTNPNDILMINNGNRVFAAPLPVPAAAGDGDEVIAVHPRPGGPASFLVLNGGDKGSVGPVQLIQTSPAP